MVTFLQFRSNALAVLSQDKTIKFNSAEEKEEWIRKEYNRHKENEARK